MNRHINNARRPQRFACTEPECDATFSTLGDLHRHERNVHGYPPSTNPNLPMPPRFTGIVSADEWQFLKKMVNICGRHDANTKSRVAVPKLANEDNHAHATAILDAVLERELREGGRDDAGGCGPLILREHALFKLSLDRKNNDLPHFVAGKPTLANLSLVPHGLNTRANPVGHHGVDFCEVVRAAARETEVEDVPTYRSVTNKAYDSTQHTWNSKSKGEWKDPACREAFANLDEIWAHTKKLLAQQGARCAITNVPLRFAEGEKVDLWRQASLDAIDPRTGHDRGNLRWICMGFNSSNNDKKKTYDLEYDPPTAWTQKLWEVYARVHPISS